MRQTSKGLWEASLSLGRRADGGRYRIHAYGKTKKEALAKLREIQQQPRAMKCDKATMAGYLDVWLADKLRSVAQSTHKRYEYASRYVRQYLGHYQIKDIGPPHIRQWYADMTADQVSLSNQAKSAQLAGMVFRCGMADLICIANPCSVVPAPRPPKREIEFLTPEEIKLFLAAADKNRMFGLFNLALATGARLGEMLALEWRDINFETGTVTFQRTLNEVENDLYVKDTKTAAGRRTVQLAHFALDALHQQRKNNVLEGLAACPLCFPSKRGTYQRRSNVHRNYFKPSLAAAGLPPIKFHALRHSAATWLLSLGATPKDVSAILGHTSSRFTIEVYTHTTLASRTAAIAKMDEALG